MPLVSVVIPVYNGEKYIRQTLDSVFAQTFKNLEVIVIDDGSTDGTAEVVRSYGDKIVFLRGNHSGPATSRNRGIDSARGPLVAFLDADDLWSSDKIEKQVAIAQSHPEYGLITCDAPMFDAAGMIVSSQKKGRPVATGYVLKNLLQDNWVGTSGVMVRRECFDKVGMFYEEPFVWGEDWVMWLRIAARYPIYFIDESLVHYRVHGGSYGHVSADKHFQDLLYYLEKLERTVPEFAQHREWVQDARFRLCWRAAWDHMQGLRPYSAREKLWQSVRYRPMSPKAWALLGISCAPLPILRSLKGTLRAVRARIKCG